MSKKEELLVNYTNLSKKLGRPASFSQCKTFGISEKMIRHHYGNISKLKEMATAKDPTLELLEVPVLMTFDDVDNYRMQLEKKLTKKTNSSMVQNASTLDYIEQFAENVFSGKAKKGKLPPMGKKLERVHTLMLSDLHFGADLKGDETGVADYLAKEEARRFASIIKHAAEYKSQYRKNTKLVIALIGDIIENQMHDPRTGATMAEQCCRAIHLLLQGIAYLAQHYPEVEIHCATGNHDRITSRHRERAIHQKFDSHATIIYYALKAACKNLKNVFFFIPKTPMGSYEVFGKRIGYTHGCTVLKVGNPYTSINVKALETQINKINAALSDKDEFAAVLYGHTHLHHTVYLPNGCILIGNGSLPPPDHFGVSLGSYEAANGQVIFESVPGHAVGDIRFIKTGTQYDKDASLDAVIKPWEDFNK